MIRENNAAPIVGARAAAETGGLPAAPTHKNASDSIRTNREFDSNEIAESDLQYEKHDELRISIL
jgi:hypothetical protein